MTAVVRIVWFVANAVLLTSICGAIIIRPMSRVRVAKRVNEVPTRK